MPRFTIPEDLEGHLDLPTAIRSGAWGNHLTLLAYATAAARPVVVLRNRDDVPMVVFPHGGEDAVTNNIPVLLYLEDEIHYRAILPRRDMEVHAESDVANVVAQGVARHSKRVGRTDFSQLLIQDLSQRGRKKKKRAKGAIEKTLGETLKQILGHFETLFPQRGVNEPRAAAHASSERAVASPRISPPPTPVQGALKESGTREKASVPSPLKRRRWLEDDPAVELQGGSQNPAQPVDQGGPNPVPDQPDRSTPLCRSCNRPCGEKGKGSSWARCHKCSSFEHQRCVQPGRHGPSNRQLGLSPIVLYLCFMCRNDEEEEKEEEDDEEDHNTAPKKRARLSKRKK